MSTPQLAPVFTKPALSVGLAVLLTCAFLAVLIRSAWMSDDAMIGSQRRSPLRRSIGRSSASLLACTGVFGTVAYAVSRRDREIGIRVALGSAWQAAAVSTILGNMLFGLSPHDPMSFVPLPAVLFTIALAACCVPARRALTVDPTKALRTEYQLPAPAAGFTVCRLHSFDCCATSA